VKTHSLLDPLSNRARDEKRDQTREPVLLIRSDAATLLASELCRYCRKEITGRSFLIAGHRGSGKTTLTGQAFLDVSKECQKQNLLMRPLYVPLHGPTLFSEPRRNESSPERQPSDQIQQSAGSHETLRIVLEDARRPSLPSEQKSDPESDEIRRTLEQIVLCLHRAVAREISDAYRLRATESAEDVRAEHLELAAQLEIELWEGPSAQRLRELWRRARVLRQGVLFNSADRLDQGLLELVALTGVCEAYRRISGIYTRQESQQDAASSKSALSLAIDSTGKNLFGPLLSVLTGGLVGAGLFAANVDALEATLAGFITALGASVVFKFSASRSRERTLASQQTFLFDMTLATLDRDLPMLIQRLLNAGLAPMFVIDELDKVENVFDRFPWLVRYLKMLVTERAFFCFLTDRSYFDEITFLDQKKVYSIESSYFAHRLFIAFQFPDFHSYLANVLVPPEEPVLPNDRPYTAEEQKRSDEYEDEKADREVLPWVLLHRAQMHALDLRRLLEQWPSTLRRGDIRTMDEFRFDVTIQVATEIILTQPALNRRLRQQPEFTQLTYDALYFISRHWKGCDEVDLEDEAKFRSYLVQRSGARPQEGETDRRLNADLPFLLDQVRGLAELLSSTQALTAKLAGWNKDRDTVGLPLLEKRILTTLEGMLKLAERKPAHPVDPAEECLLPEPVPEPEPLLERHGHSWKFTWRFRPDGRSVQRQAPAAEALPAGGTWVRDAELIRQFAATLGTLTG